MTTENQQNKRKIQILPPLPVTGTFTYACDAQSVPAAGAFVDVPFGKKTLTGVVWEAAPAETVDDSKIRPIEKILALPVLPSGTRKLISWVAGYTLFPEGAVLKLCLINAATRTMEQQ